MEQSLFAFDDSLLFDDSNALSHGLNQRALVGLAFEWEGIAGYYVKGTAKSQFLQPTFEISDMATSWAHWNRECHKMTFSQNLISNYSWHDVVKVLKHEMAHQYADCVFHAYKRDTSHGLLFKDACKVFRIEANASTDLVLSDDNPQATKQDRIVSKVHKLLSLASSNNQNEANSAMVAAQKLIESYNLDIIKQDKQRHFGTRRIGSIMPRRPRYMYSVAGLLTMFYHVNAIWENSYSIVSEKKGNVLTIIGTDSNLEIAEYVHDFVHEYIDSHWLKAKRKMGVTSFKKNDFAIGVINGFVEKIQQQHADANTATNKHELTVVLDPKLDAYYQFLYPRTSKIKRKSRSVHKELYQHGLDKGKDMIIHKGIHHQNGNRQNLLDS